jgi:hypothetical protein
VLLFLFGFLFGSSLFFFFSSVSFFLPSLTAYVYTVQIYTPSSILYGTHVHGKQEYWTEMFFPSASTSSLSFWTNPTTFGSWDEKEKVCPDVSESIPNVLAIHILVLLFVCFKKGKSQYQQFENAINHFLFNAAMAPIRIWMLETNWLLSPLCFSVSPSSTFTCLHDFPSRKKAHKVQMQQTHTHK